MRKTIRVADIVADLNDSIAYIVRERYEHATPEFAATCRAELSALCYAAERILNQADAYRGFKYIAGDPAGDDTRAGRRYEFARCYHIADEIR